MLLCQNERGYRNLTRLVTRSRISKAAAQARPDARRAWLDADDDRGPDRTVGRARRRCRPRAGRGPRRRSARGCSSAGWRCSATATTSSCSAPGAPARKRASRASLAARRRLGVPVVATNDVRFLRRDDFEAHEARVCIQEGTLLADDSRAAALQRRAVPALARGDGASCSPTCPRRSRIRSRSRAAEPRAQARQVVAAGVSGAGRARRPKQHLRDEARTRPRGALGYAADAGSARRFRASTTTRVSRSSSASSARWDSRATS